jgi:predicted nuclease of predicted toxin-antitoxin system
LSLLFDQNVSCRLPMLLAAEYPGSQQVVGIGLPGADDRVIWSYAAVNGLTIVSKDVDFRHMALLLGPPPKVIWLRVGNGSTGLIESLLRHRLADVQTFLADPSAALLKLP